MSTTPLLITDTRGDAGRILVTPYTGEAEVRRWLYASYGSPPWLRANHEEETAASMIEAIEAVVDVTDGRGTGEQREFVASYLGLQIEYLDEWDSSVFDWRPSGCLGREITATAPDGAEISFSAKVWGDEITAHFIVELPEKELGRKYVTTTAGADWSSTDDLSLIERYVPRDEWPACMWLGPHGPNQRHPAPEVQAVVDKAVSDRAAAFAESHRIILEWRHSEHLRNDWLHPNTVFIVEEWTVYVYKIVEDGRDEDDVENYVEPPEWLADLSSGFEVDPEDEDAPDTTEGVPFEEAEERLLAKAGLPRSIVLRVDGPW